MLPHRTTALSLALVTAFAAPTYAQQQDDDIVISASRVETKRFETGSSIVVLDEQYIKDNQARSVVEILQDVPGITVSRNGGIGSTTSVFIRGASSNQTLVIIDGVEVNDLSSITGGYNFSTLMADNIERIEVLKGAQSALWGSDAMGGVINIVTKKGRGELSGNLDLEAGSRNSYKQSANVNGATGKTHYSFSASNITTDGISAKKESTGGEETDAYDNQTFALKGGTEFNETFAADAIVRYSKDKNEYDNTDDAATNAGLYGESEQRLAKLSTHANFLNKQWLNTLSFAYSDFERKDINAAYGDSEGHGKKVKVDLQSHYYFQPINKFSQRISFVAEHEQDSYQSWGMVAEDEMAASGLVFEYSAEHSKTYFFTAAVRHDLNDKFDDTTTYHLDAAAWVTDGTRLHASHGTGVKNPTFGQLYGFAPSSWGDYRGNPNLKPEESTSYDLGVEYNFASIDGYVDLTYFNTSYDAMHDYYLDPVTWEGTYINLEDGATSEGLEFALNVRPIKPLRLNAGYTYNKTDDGEGNQLTRRPEHSASINANYQYTEKLSSNIGIRYMGEREDRGATLDDYNILNIAATYQVHPRIAVFGRVENVLDKEYENITGYNTEPLSAYIGVSFR